MEENELNPESKENIDQELLLEYETRYRGRSDDATAMQAAVCVVLGASVFVLNIIFPGTAAGIFNKIKELAADSSELFPNPINLLRPFFD